MEQAFDRNGNVLGEAFGETAGGFIPVKDSTEAEPMLQWFEYAHLPPHLQDASKPFCDLATKVGTEWPRNAERTVTLRKLLEAKDAAVRSLISKA